MSVSCSEESWLDEVPSKVMALTLPVGSQISMVKDWLASVLKRAEIEGETAARVIVMRMTQRAKERGRFLQQFTRLSNRTS